MKDHGAFCRQRYTRLLSAASAVSCGLIGSRALCSGSEDQKMKIPTVAIVFALMATTAAANATDSICEAVALHATTETKDFPSALKRGETIDAVTQYNVNKKTGVASLCSHGGGCYPAEALRLTNCRVNKSKSDFEDGDEVSYGLDVIRSKVPPTILRQNDVELKLLDLGMCNACPLSTSKCQPRVAPS
jgi:hypothetical protein